MTKKEKFARWPVVGFFLIWMIGILVGSWLMLDHEFGTGTTVWAPERLPEKLQPFAKGELPYTLVLAVHPECTCTRATIEQVERLLASSPGRFQTIAIFSSSIRPQNSITSLGNRYWDTLAKLPETTLVPDPNGSLAQEIGAPVSGSVAVYDQAGILRFRGGLTASRGHSGSSVGLSELQQIAKSFEPRELCSTPVFGCSLKNPIP